MYPNSKVHGANMGPIWGRQDPGGPDVGPMNFAIWVSKNWVIIVSGNGLSQSYYLNQHWLVIKGVLCHLPEWFFKRKPQDTQSFTYSDVFENYALWSYFSVVNEFCLLPSPLIANISASQWDNNICIL